jgi:hypothetical protein
MKEGVPKAKIWPLGHPLRLFIKPLFDFFKGLIKIGEDVVDMFRADGKADRGGGNPAGAQFLFIEL